MIGKQADCSTTETFSHIGTISKQQKQRSRLVRKEVLPSNGKMV